MEKEKKKKKYIVKALHDTPASISNQLNAEEEYFLDSGIITKESDAGERPGFYNKAITSNVVSSAATFYDYDKSELKNAEKKRKEKKKILQESEYVNSLSDIIKRDFFPDLPKIEAQYEYLKGLERNDWQIMVNAVKKIEALESVCNEDNDHLAPIADVTNIGKEKKEIKMVADISIDQFQTLFTSEDNASFEALLEKMNQEKSQKYKWIYDQVQKNALLLKSTLSENSSLPKNLLTFSTNDITKEKDLNPTSASRRIEKVVIESNSYLLMEEKSALVSTISPMTSQMNAATKTYDGNFDLDLFSKKEETPVSSGTIDSWKYTVKNSLMYGPEGIGSYHTDPTPPNKKIIHQNTRLDLLEMGGKPSPSISSNIKDYYYKICEEYLGLNEFDGNTEGISRKIDTIGERSDRSFVPNTPLLIPGENITPIMTWGTIESSPLLLSNTASSTGMASTSSGPTFKIPPIREREKIGHRLSRKASASIRERLGLSSDQKSPALSKNPTPKSILMSPAAKRMVSAYRQSVGKSSKDVDSQLRASYDPKSPYYGKKGTSASPALTSSIRTSTSSSERTTNSAG